MNNLVKQSFFPLFLISIFLLPLSLETNLNFLPAQLIFMIEPFAFTSCILLATAVIINFKQLTFNTLDKLVILYVLANVLSVVFSENKIVSLKYNITITWYICIGYVLPQWIIHKKNLITKTLLSFLLGISILSIYVFYNISQFGIFFESSYWISMPFIPQGHTNLSVVIEPALVCVLLLFLATQKRIFQIGFFLLLAVIMYSCSRASYISLGIMFVSGLILFKKSHRLTFLTTSIMGFIICISIWYLNDYIHYLKYKDSEISYFKSNSSHYNSKDIRTFKHTSIAQELGQMDKYKDDKSNNERVERWKAGLNFWKNNIFTGIGIGTYPDKYLAYIQQKNDTLNELQMRRMNIHNLYLSWLVEGGILLFFAGMSILGYVFWKNVTYVFSKKYSFIKIGSCLCFLSFLFHGLGQDFSQDPRIIIPFWLMVSLFSDKKENPLSKNQ